MERLQTNIVPPDGPPDAKICFIGEAPGQEEDRQLRPFVGDAGSQFNRMLLNVGLQRRDVLINNVFAQQPPRNDVHYFFQDKMNRVPTWEGQEHVDRLKKWLQELLDYRLEGASGPNVLVALGAVALYQLTGKRRITKWRGSVLPCTLVPGFKVYAMYHPSYVNRLMNEPEEKLFGARKSQQQNVLPLTLKDLERVEQQAESPDYERPEREFLLNLSLEEIVEELRNLKGKTVAVDIETLRGPEGPILWCCGFAATPYRAFVVPFLKSRRFVWTLDEEAVVLNEISKMFLDPTTTKVFHNGLYDLSVLGRYYGLRVADGSYQDTMYCYQATYPYLRKALEVLTSIYTWEPYYKDDGKVHDGKRISDAAEFVYNARDCCITREIWPFVERDAHELGTWTGYRRSMSVVPSLMRMGIRGVKIDLQQKIDLATRFEQKSGEQWRTIINETADLYTVEMADKKWKGLNLRSSKQVATLVYEKLRMPVQYHHKTKKPSTDKDAIKRLKKKFPDNVVIEALAKFREFSKLADTYTKMEVSSDGRIRTAYGWVSTYRLSSSESFFGGGGNLQNIPVRTEEGRLIRDLFIADQGFTLVASDLAQAEARVVAWLAGDNRLIEAFLAGVDVHWENAKLVFGIPNEVEYYAEEQYRDQITGQYHSLKFFRRLAKTIVHATNYLMGPRMLQNILIREEVYLPEKTCRQFIHSYKTNSPLIVRWQDSVREQIRANRTLITPIGRKRIFRGRLNENLFRSAVAFTPQSTVGELLQISIQRIHEEISDVFEPLLNVHDEVVGQCKPEDVEAVLPEIKKRMEIPIQIHGRELVIPCDFKIGDRWGSMKEVVYNG